MILVVYMNMTEIKTLEMEKLEAISLAERIQRERAEEAEDNRTSMELFVDAVCHEIRNPLNGILNNLEFCRENQSRIDDLIGSVPTTQTQVQALQADSQALLATVRLCVEQLVQSDKFKKGSKRFLPLCSTA